MAKLALSLLAFAQLSLVYGRPALDAEAERRLDQRDVPSLTSLEPTISYSTAIETLQSVSITVLPSITGVRGHHPCLRQLLILSRVYILPCPPEALRMIL